MREHWHGSGTGRRRIVAFVIAAAVLVGGAPAGVLSGAAAAAGGSCHAPFLEGLTFKLARVLARRAGCKVRTRGNPLAEASIQTVARQSPAAGAVASTVTVWLNRLCQTGGGNGPLIKEPTVTAGATKLISGFFDTRGKPPHYFSAPKCPRSPEPPPGAGTVEVIDSSGALVATQTSAARQFVEIPLPAGEYTIRGTFGTVTFNGARAARSETVVIPPGHTVRQDFIVSVP